LTELVSCCFAGDYFGELALLPGGNTRAATVRARTDVSLLVLDRANFESLLGALMPQLQAASKNYTGYKPKQGIQVTVLSQLLILQRSACQSAKQPLVQWHACTQHSTRPVRPSGVLWTFPTLLTETVTGTNIGSAKPSNLQGSQGSRGKHFPPPALHCTRRPTGSCSV
jgi:hypothetical protein